MTLCYLGDGISNQCSRVRHSAVHYGKILRGWFQELRHNINHKLDAQKTLLWIWDYRSRHNGTAVYLNASRPLPDCAAHEMPITTQPYIDMNNVHIISTIVWVGTRFRIAQDKSIYAITRTLDTLADVIYGHFCKIDILLLTIPTSYIIHKLHIYGSFDIKTPL